jgi:hypothetical protein
MAIWLVLVTVLSTLCPLSIADEKAGFRKEYRMFLIGQWLESGQQ